jgi:phosphate uptake regulator
MKRKAIQLANQTLVISLPSKWVKEQGIKKGDEIDIVEEGEKLIVGVSLGQEIKILTLDIREYSKSILYRHLHTLYRRGYDKLILKIKDSSQLKSIEETIKDLIGFEIVEQSKTECVIEGIAESQTKDVNKLIKRVIMLMMSMCEELQDDTKKLESEKLKDIILTDVQINKFTDYIIRLINKKIIDPNIKREILYFLAMQLELIGDRCKTVAEKVTELTCEKRIFNFNPLTMNFLKESYGILLLFNSNMSKESEKTSIKKIEETRENINKIYEKINQSKLSKKELEVCDLVKDNIYTVFDILEEFMFAP